ncbi:MAG: hypothetical protein ACJA1L_001339 [Paracoccaceae bacterium]
MLFVMLGVAPRGTTLRQGAAAALFLACDLTLIGLMAMFPSIVLYPPSLM